MKKPNLSIDLATVNADERNSSLQDLGTTYRAEGLSIGRNYLRFEGEIIAETPSIDEFIIDGTIGRGISSVVFRARLKDDESKKFYALKEFQLDNKANQDVYAPSLDATEKKKQSSMVIQELKILCKLQCECLVQLVGAFYEPGRVIMAMEYMDYGSLAQFLRMGEGVEMTNEMAPRVLSENALAGAAYQILWGLAYLHHENIIHRDIKPANILLNSSGRIKVSDMGISGFAAFTKTEDDATISGLNHTVIGTSKYMSPERILDKAYGPLCDVWSFGLVLIECATGGWSPLSVENQSVKRPTHRKGILSIIELAMTLEEFDVDEVIKSLSKNASEKSKMAGEVDWCKVATSPSGGLGEILIWSLQRAPNKRMPAQILLDSPWFQSHEVSNIESAQQSIRCYINTVA
eukprot:scaffold1093_cov226-Chaetoceros_neogracile.AAC.3